MASGDKDIGRLKSGIDFDVSALDKASQKAQEFQKSVSDTFLKSIEKADRTKKSFEDLSKVIEQKLGKEAVPAARKAIQDLSKTGFLDDSQASKAIKHFVDLGHSVEDATKLVKSQLSEIAKKTKDLEAPTNKFSNAWNVVKGIFIGGVIAAGISKIVSISKDFIDASIRADNAVKGLSAVVKSRLGEDAIPAAKKAMQELMDTGLMNQAEASQAIKNLTAMGFSIQDSTKLLKAQLDIAVDNKQAHYGLGESVLVYTEGLKNQNSMLTDSTGISENLSVTLKKVGMKMEDLSSSTKGAAARQALMNAHLKEASAFAGRAAEVSNEYQGASAKLSVEVDKLKQLFGKLLTLELSGWFKDASKYVKEFTAIVKLALDPVGSLMDRIGNFDKVKKLSELKSALSAAEAELWALEQKEKTSWGPSPWLWSDISKKQKEIQSLSQAIIDLNRKGSSSTANHSSQVNNLKNKWKEVLKMVQDYLKDDSFYGQLKAINEQYDKIMSALGNEKAFEMMEKLNDARLRKLEKASESAWSSIQKITSPDAFAEIERKYQKLDDDLFAIWDQNDKKKFDLAEERRKLNEAKELEKAQLVADKTVQVMQGAANAIQAIQDEKLGNFISSMGLMAGAVDQKWGAIISSIGIGVNIIEGLLGRHKDVNDQLEIQRQRQEEINRLQIAQIDGLEDVYNIQTKINTLKYGANSKELAIANLSSKEGQLKGLSSKGGDYAIYANRTLVELYKTGEFYGVDIPLMGEIQSELSDPAWGYTWGADFVQKKIDKINELAKNLQSFEFRADVAVALTQLKKVYDLAKSRGIIGGTSHISGILAKDYKAQFSAFEKVVSVKEEIKNLSNAVTAWDVNPEKIKGTNTETEKSNLPDISSTSFPNDLNAENISKAKDDIANLDLQYQLGKITKDDYKNKKLAALDKLKGYYTTGSTDYLSVEKQINDFNASLADSVKSTSQLLNDLNAENISKAKDDIANLDLQYQLGKITKDDYKNKKLAALDKLKGYYTTGSTDYYSVEKMINDFNASLADSVKSPSQLLNDIVSGAKSELTLEELQTAKGEQGADQESKDKLSIFEKLKSNLINFLIPSDLIESERASLVGQQNQELLWAYENINKITEDLKGVQVTNEITNLIANLNYHDQSTYLDALTHIEERITPKLMAQAAMVGKTIYASRRR